MKCTQARSPVYFFFSCFLKSGTLCDQRGGFQCPSGTSLPDLTDNFILYCFFGAVFGALLSYRVGLSAEDCQPCALDISVSSLI
jgi:hypothetical protein